MARSRCTGILFDQDKVLGKLRTFNDRPLICKDF